MLPWCPQTWLEWWGHLLSVITKVAATKTDNMRSWRQWWAILFLAGCSTSCWSYSAWTPRYWWSPGQLCLLAGRDGDLATWGPPPSWGDQWEACWLTRQSVGGELPGRVTDAVWDIFTFRFIYSPECLGIMSRKRSSEGSSRDKKVETSGVLFELEDSRDKEKLSGRQRLRRLLAETEREKQDFDEVTHGFRTGISTVSWQECLSFTV